MWPQAPAKKRSNQVAKRLLEDGYVIVSEKDLPPDVKPYGWKEEAPPIELRPGEAGDVLTRVDSFPYAGRYNWASPTAIGSKTGIPEVPDDGNVYVRKSGEWVLLSDYLAANK